MLLESFAYVSLLFIMVYFFSRISQTKEEEKIFHNLRAVLEYVKPDSNLWMILVNKIYLNKTEQKPLCI